MIKLTRIPKALRVMIIKKNPEIGIENVFFQNELTPGVYELVDINNTIKQILFDSDFEVNIRAGTMPLNSVLTTSNNIHFNSELT